MIYPGTFYARYSDAGHKYEVVMGEPEHVPLAKSDLTEAGVQVGKAVMGHFSIYMHDPRQWGEVGSIIAGPVIPIPEIKRS